MRLCYENKNKKSPTGYSWMYEGKVSFQKLGVWAEHVSQKHTHWRCIKKEMPHWGTDPFLERNQAVVCLATEVWVLQRFETQENNSGDLSQLVWRPSAWDNYVFFGKEMQDFLFLLKSRYRANRPWIRKLSTQGGVGVLGPSWWGTLMLADATSPWGSCHLVAEGPLQQSAGAFF